MRQIGFTESAEILYTVPNLIKLVKCTNDIVQIEPITVIVGVTNEIKQPIDQIVSHWSLDNIDIWSVPVDLLRNVKICFTESDQNMIRLKRILKDVEDSEICNL